MIKYIIATLIIQLITQILDVARKEIERQKPEIE